MIKMLELISWLQELRPKEYIRKDSLNAAIPSPRRKKRDEGHSKS